jgi:hypothetical protein
VGVARLDVPLLIETLLLYFDLPANPSVFGVFICRGYLLPLVLLLLLLLLPLNQIF